MRPFFNNNYIKRYREIINILSKHGLGHLLELTGFYKALRLPWKRKEQEPQISIAERLRMVLEELGPTFIKLGQILSTRHDLLPEIYIAQLEMLQDRINPVEFDEIEQTIVEELRQPLDNLFINFQPTPIASASIGQVHDAFLLTGEHVVVKIQRRGVAKVIETDLAILYDVARFLEARTEWGKLYKVQSLVDEFARTIRDELDYISEAKNSERFRQNFADDPTIYFPKVYWNYTRQKVLVLEYVAGIKITSRAELEQAAIDKPEIAKKITIAFFKQLFIDGFFHADPHPGNIAIGENSVIILMDLGMVGRLESWIKDLLGTMLVGIVRKDVNSVLQILHEFGNEASKLSEPRLKRDLHYLFDKYYYCSLKEIKLGIAFRDLLEISAKYQIQIPQELVLMIRCLILLENVVSRLDPTSNVIELAKSFGPKLLLEKLSPENLLKSIADYLIELANMLTNLPGRINHLLQIATDGELKIVLEHHNFDNLILRLIVLGNRLSFSMIIAATIIGSSLIALKNSESIFGRFPIAEAGFIIAVLMGLWLLIAIIRSGKI